MYRSLQLTLPFDNVIFGTKPVISPENITDDMMNDDRYDCYSIDGAFHNQAFCELCDICNFKIQFHELADYCHSKSGKEISEILVFHSQNDCNTFIAFDMWQGRTDQCDVIDIGISFNENLWNEIYNLFDIISQDCFPFSAPVVKTPSKLIQSMLFEVNGKCFFFEVNGKCFFKHREYVVKHIN